jgi:hypothetical protein
MTDPRSPARRTPDAPPLDPADLGTAFGMELSITPNDADAKQDASAEDDPLHWIRTWLERHTPR